MNDFLDWFRLDELFQILALAGLLAFIGGQMVRPDSETYRRARRISAAVFLLYAGMGMYAWGLNSVTELLLIILRASLAAGVAFGLALVTLAPAVFLIEKARAFMPRKTKSSPVETPTPPAQPAVILRDYAAEERAEKERMIKIDDARTMTEQFYADNAELLAETLPQALFTTQMRTRFPDGIAPDQAWSAAQDLISEMIPLIKAAREKRRTDDEEERKRAEQAAKESKPDDGRTEVQRITDWYQREKGTLLTLPDNDEREVFLIQLKERCDRMMKDALAEAQP